MPKGRDWMIIAAALLIALGIFVVTRSGILDNGIGSTDPMSVLKEVTEPGATAAPAGNTVTAYLVVTVANTRYKPMPITHEADYRLHQANGHDNLIHVTKDSIYMKEANCDNQNCIHQGTVTLTNTESRVLGNMIICLPNQVVLELVTPEEAGTAAQ